MKKTVFLSAVCLLLALASCQKKEEKQWDKCYGYELDDIVGTFSFSNVSDAFDGLGADGEGLYCHICKDARIAIQRSSGRNIAFDIDCPTAGFSYLFQGNPKKTDGDFLVTLASGYFYSGGKLCANRLTAYVYMNEAQQVRLHGFAATDVFTVVNHPETQSVDTLKESSNTYYFDVIKN